MFAVIFCVATLLFVPGLILTIGAGVAFGRALGFGYGLLWGSVAVLIGAMAACIIAFYLGRSVAAPYIHTWYIYERNKPSTLFTSLISSTLF